MKTNQTRLRQVHKVLAPIVLLPLLLTLITGSIYQIVDLGGKGDAYDWLLDWHKGHFGSLNLETIYPFLNSLGLLIMVITGISMWLQLRRRARNRSGEV